MRLLKVLMLFQMFQDMIQFVLLLAVFLFAYGVATQEDFEIYSEEFNFGAKNLAKCVPIKYKAMNNTDFDPPFW